MDCLFCKIASKAIPATIAYEDNEIVIFDDISPQAPIHKLIIPKKHLASPNDISTSDTGLIGHMVQSASQLAKQLDIANDGYRLVFNCNLLGGQTVSHIHLHLLAGRQMTWPPG